ncbi:MAG: HEPN domain-containing protein [Candidatus Omnitrophota bacterium]
MGEKAVNLEYGDCLKKGKIKPFSRGSALALKELEAAASDLGRAKKTFEEDDYKWATIQIYYSMFHSARTLLYSKNLREHSHYCLILAVRALFVETKTIPVHFIEALQEAKNLREEADYYNRWSEAGCEKLLNAAEAFLKKVKEIISKTK